MHPLIPSTKTSPIGKAATNSVILARRRLDPATEEEVEKSPERAVGRRSTATANILEVAEELGEEQVARSEVLWAQRAGRKGEVAPVVAAAPELSNIGEESGEGSRPASREGSGGSREGSTEVAGRSRGRRSVYQAGQPEEPGEGPLELEGSREVPAGESTRLGASPADPALPTRSEHSNFLSNIFMDS